MTGHSRTSRSHPRRSVAGFTLLELLVVVFIIGILATMFTLSVDITGGDQEIEQELDRLYALLELAGEEATLQGRELGLRFVSGGYEFAAYEEAFDDYPAEPENSADSIQSEEDEVLIEVSEWLVIANGALKPRRLPPDVEIELEIDGRAVILRDAEREYEDDAIEVDEYRPQIFIFSSGEVSPFVVLIRREFENRGFSLEVKADGTIEMKRGEQ